ncbi:MAG: hypothetical protein ABI947_03395 [Chloroflexota bacterium]
MTEMFTVELSEEAARRAQEIASRKGRPVEVVLSEWIERDALAEEFSPLIPGVEYPIYTPVGNEAAAAVLMELLKKTKEADKKAGK